MATFLGYALDVTLNPKRDDALGVLHDRYGLVIGHRQAESYIAAGQSDQKAFEDNARRLELRLVSLGLLRRLSDACAYVENPFTTGGR